MLIDTRSTFAWEEGVDGSAGTVKLGEAMDLEVEANQGEGYPLYLVILFTTTTAGGTSTAYNLVTADNAALDSNPVTLLSTPVYPVADGVAGVYAIVVPLPKADYKRYLGITVTRVGTVTAGAVSAFLVQDPPAWRAYPEGMN